MVAGLRESDPKRFERIADAIRKSSIGIITREESTLVIAAELEITPDEYIQKISSGEVKNEELLGYIKKLRRKYKVGMLSNVSSGGLKVRFKPGELDGYFDAVIASGDIGYAKPEALAYEIAADKLGVRFNECVMIDDREDYCQGAVSVGMRAVQYDSFGQMRRELEALLR
jgi:HAD superfamily hydrolase (TIGR01509 family)